jgi:hypothetical protein
VLDDFNRAAGKIGPNWTGPGTNNYRIIDHILEAKGGGPIYWQGALFGPNQEVFATLTRPRGVGAALLLKVQNQGWQKGVIRIFYDHNAGEIGIQTNEANAGWRTLAVFDNQNLNPGDTLGARALANGDILVYVNCQLIGQAHANFFANKGGRIGVWYHDSHGAKLDNFGGGDSSP